MANNSATGAWWVTRAASVASANEAAAAAQGVVTNAMFLMKSRAQQAGANKTNVRLTEFLTAAEKKAYLDATAVIKHAEMLSAGMAGSGAAPKPKPPRIYKEGVIEPDNYKWNLPPHSWSLPVRPMTLEPDITNGVFEYYTKQNDTIASPGVTKTPINFHSLRRGRIWFFGGADEINAYAEDGTVTTLGEKAGAITDAKKSTTDSSAKLVDADLNYGFQFLWNPNSVSSSVSRNMDITPSASDRLKSVVGAFPGQETVSFSIVIDRINDFACIKNLLKGSGTEVVARNLESMSKYYKTGFPGVNEPMSTKIRNLMEQGTMADLEYLFKAINGGSEQWMTLLKKPTANIGFLMPTLLGLVLGPSLKNNLSYVGWLTGLTMQHEMFTEEMIPLRTTVSINMECFAGSGLVSS